MTASTDETGVRSFLGIPVNGDIIDVDRVKDQRPVEELAPFIQAMLDDPHVIRFGWQQYTPYFNDGEPCVFSACTLWVQTTLDEDEGYNDLTIDGHPTLSETYWEGNSRKTRNLSPWQQELADKAESLSKEITGGSFDRVLIDSFGDHASVTVTRVGINVEHYEHD